MTSIGSSLLKVQSSITSSAGAAADVTDDGGVGTTPSATSSTPADGFDAGPAKAKVALDAPAGIANLTTPALAGPSQREELHVAVPWLSQDQKSASYDAEGDGNCNSTCRDMMKGLVSDEHGGAEPGGKRDLLPTAPISGNALATDANGRLEADPALATKAKRYIDGQLEDGHPVMVGVNRRAGATNDDGATDHFVVITGRGVDEQGRLFYSFNDPAARNEKDGSDRNPNNRFFVDQKTGLLYRDGTDGNRSRIDGHANPNYRQRYEVSQVRLNTLVAPAIDLSRRD